MTAKELDTITPKSHGEISTGAEMTWPGVFFAPPVDIFETDTDLTLVTDMPGVKAEDIDLTVNRGKLRIMGKVSGLKGTKETELVTEFIRKTYLRQFSLSEYIDQKNIQALCEDGVLRITLPKTKQAVAKKISVK